MFGSSWRGKGFGRRTTLQLGEKKDQVRGGGLVPSYEADEDEDHCPTVPLPISSPGQDSNRQTNGSLKTQESLPLDDSIGNKVADFLAEIDAITDDVDGTPMNDIQPESSEYETDECEEEELPGKPPEPKTEWESCLDKGTQYYYYWNTLTNAVTWEIPTEYSQYLLLKKEYDEKMIRYEEAVKQQRIRKEEKEKHPKKKRKKFKVDEVQLLPKSEPLKNAVQPVTSIGPHLPPCNNAKTKEILEELSLPKGQSKYSMFVKSSTMQGTLQQESTGKAIVQYPPSKIATNQPCMTEPIAVNVVLDETEGMDKSVVPEGKTRKDKGRGELPMLDYSNSSSAASSGSDTDEEKNPEEKAPHNASSVALDEDMDIEDMLDMALEGKMELSVKNKDKSEKVRERHKKDKKRRRRKERKRRHRHRHSDSEDESHSKRRHEEDGQGSQSAEKGHEQKFSEKTDEKQEIADLAALIKDKLCFLDVTRKGLSKLQLLLIETETRVSDWQAGGLSSSLLQTRLAEASRQLVQYERSAAPAGWSCHWDRYNILNPAPWPNLWPILSPTHHQMVLVTG